MHRWLRGMLTLALGMLLLPQALGGDRPPPLPMELLRTASASPTASEPASTTPKSDAVRLEELKQKLNDPESEYAKAKAEFIRLDQQRTQFKEQLAKAKAAGDTAASDRLGEQLTAHEKNCTLAKERFDLAVKERQSLEDQIATLAKKIEKLQTPVSPAAEPPSSSTPAPGETPVANGEAAASTGNGHAGDASNHKNGNGNGAVRKELADAQKRLEQKMEEARRAQDKANNTAEREELLLRQIEITEQLSSTAKQKADNADKTLRAAFETYQQKTADGAPAEAILTLRGQIDESQQRYALAQQEVHDRRDQLRQLQSELATLHMEQQHDERELVSKEAEATAAHQKVKQLENPFTLNNLTDWFNHHGSNLLLIVVGLLAARWVCKLGVRRFARMMTRDAPEEDEAARESRVRVMVGFLMRGANLLIFLAAAFLLLEEIGVPVLPLWGMISAMLAMVAIGFVAVWSVLSNMLCSVILLIYQPFSVGNKIELTTTGVSGTVVNFNLLFTTLRGEDGDYIEVPNNTFLQQAIRRRRGRMDVTLDQQLFEPNETEPLVRKAG